MVEIAEQNTNSNEWELLLNYYQELEALLEDENSDPEMITSLIEKSDQLIEKLKSMPQISNEMVLTVELLAEISGQSQKLISLMNREKDKAMNQISILKSGKTAFNAYQKPRVGMGYTEGKFLDNRK